jgi:hypothetical protein
MNRNVARCSKAIQLLSLTIALLQLSPRIAHAQPVLDCRQTTPGTVVTREMIEQCAGSRVSFGMDAALLFAKPDIDGAETTKLLTIPRQALRIDYQATSRLRFEVPFSFDYSKTDDEPSGSTLTTGLIADLCTRHLTGSYAEIANLRPQCRFFAGVGGTATRVSFNDSSITRFGVLGRIGIEHDLYGMDGRLAFLFEHRFVKDEDPGENVYGVSYGVGFPIGIFGEPTARAARMPGNPTNFHLRFGAELSREMPSEDRPKTTSILVPAPYVGFFITSGPGRELGIGANASFQWASFEDATVRHFEVAPRVEFSPMGNYLTRPGLRVGAEFLIDNTHLDLGIAGTDDITRTRYGFGGDVNYTIPCWPRNPSVFRIGVGFDHLLENSDDNIPSANVVKLSISVDRFGLRYGF